MGVQALPRSKPPFIDELRSVHRSLVSSQDLTSLHAIKKPSTALSVSAFAWDWAWIGTAFILIAHFSWLGLLPALLIIGSRQRALSNLVHDASHGNLLNNSRLNDGLTNALAAYPMLDTVASYRRSHMAHHQYLGDVELDPDSKSHLRYGFDDRAPMRGSWIQIFARLIFNRESWRDSVIGNMMALRSRDLLWIGAEWFALLAAITAGFGIRGSIEFFVSWHLARATTYHCIRLFAEFMDHAGLKPGSIIGFTRNLPHTGVIATIFQPHQDTYHLVHHLMPKVPHYHLKAAHQLLTTTTAAYSRAHFCDSYFKGNHPAVICWMGRCEKEIS